MIEEKNDIVEKTGQKRPKSPTEESDEEIKVKRSKRDSVVSSKSEENEDSKSTKSSKSENTVSNASSSTPEPGSTPDEDRSDLSEPGANRENVTLFWFTEAALRMSDNPGLKAALQHCKAVRFCYFLDPRFVTMDSPRWKFIKSALNDIDDQLKKLGSRLHVLSGQPSEQLPIIFNDWNIVRLGFSSHPGCNESRLRDRAIVSLALRHGIEVVYREAPHSLFTPSEVIKACGGQIPLTFKRFCNVIASMNLPVTSIKIPESEIVMNSLSDDHDEIEKNACLLDKDDKDFPWAGGETEARCRFKSALSAWKIAKNGKPDLRTVTPYIIQGCISPRDIFHQINAVYEEIFQKKADLSIHVAQLHRDYLYCHGSIDKNDLILNIQYDSTDLGRTWLEGKTGYPWVDAVIRQLKTEGWCAPLLRQAALWFLTRGMLWQKTEIGISFLSEHCLFDLALAKGYTHWAAGVGSWIEDDVTNKCPDVDPNYIRTWVPEVRHLSNEYIQKPWLIPANQIPSDYVKICVPHRQSHKQSQAKYQLSLTTESNKFLTRLDQIGRSGKIFFPIRLEPNPWEIVQTAPFQNNITGLSQDITQTSFMQYVQKTQQNWNKLRTEVSQ